MEFFGEFSLIFVRLLEIDVDVEASSFAICYGIDELTVCFAGGFGGWIYEGFAV